MKNIKVLVLILMALYNLNAVSRTVQPIITDTGLSRSLIKETKHAVDKGLNWLLKKQKPEGYWSEKGYPALTALVVSAIYRSPNPSKDAIQAADRGIEYIVSCVQKDGGIYVKGLSNYNTAVCITALVDARNPKYYKIIKKARGFLISQQQDDGKKGVADALYDGGFGYEKGTKRNYSDMSNTVLAIEAIRRSEFLDKDRGKGGVIYNRAAQKPNWNAVIKFLQKCHHDKRVNKQSWVMSGEKDKDTGSFIYKPGDSKVKETLPDGRVALRGYASMTYAGLLSYIYAKLKKDDFRVQSTVRWLKNNFSLKENPGLDQQGLYYYYHLMAKALSAYGDEIFITKSNKRVNWRKELIKKMLELQKGDGSWVNKNGRWWESDPVLVTAYAILTLEISASR
jgi:squalene-hopene/tetraprenyl-beta-curcumene cyclase